MEEGREAVPDGVLTSDRFVAAASAPVTKGFRTEEADPMRFMHHRPAALVSSWRPSLGRFDLHGRVDHISAVVAVKIGDCVNGARRVCIPYYARVARAGPLRRTACGTTHSGCAQLVGCRGSPSSRCARDGTCTGLCSDRKGTLAPRKCRGRWSRAPSRSGDLPATWTPTAGDHTRSRLAGGLPIEPDPGALAGEVRSGAAESIVKSQSASTSRMQRTPQITTCALRE